MSKKSKQTKSYVLKVPLPVWKRIQKEKINREKTYEEMLLIGAELSAHLEQVITLTGAESLEELLTQIQAK